MKKNLGIVFGAKSAEHEVSVVTMFQAYKLLDKSKYNLFLIYIDKNNKVFLCPKLRATSYKKFIKKTLKLDMRIDFVNGGFVKRNVFKKYQRLDAVLLTMHGSFGEDGKLQGVFDFLNIPYTGTDVLGSVVGMDKVLMKPILKDLFSQTLNYVWFYGSEFKKNENVWLSKIKNSLKFPLFVKPANAGSSVGISRVDKQSKLRSAIDYALNFDRKVLVEEALDGAVDINCAVIGGRKTKVSVCEQPLSGSTFLSFDEKYLKGSKKEGMASLSRIMPAPIPAKISESMQDMARRLFDYLGGWGMVRIDFLYQPKTKVFYLNEINTIPGSLSYYLWEASGLNGKKLIDRMVDLAIERHRKLGKLKLFFKSKILD
ncbi:D-alanine--D-alanine ligase [Candidatus Shapirobacteria bacterium]|nr:MAG: D-alanine--D-alanine ligase [Candidatus Shapirobacteria bacterium]